jgi:hypothetical protein
MSFPRRLAAVVATALTLSGPAVAQKHAPDTTADGPDIPHQSVKAVGADGKEHKCLEQKAQDFLIRKNWFPANASPDDAKAAKAMFQQSIDFRTKNYGRFPGFGSAKDNKKSPAQNAKATTFFGSPIQINERVIPALKCVEAALLAGKLDSYKPSALSGLRLKNSYRGSEVSNHVYGIAVDVDPNQNTCCSCVAPWPDHPLCKKKVTSVFERMKMPRAWVIVFERYGFYWLGHDVLQDTMHFEFLGDPDKIQDGQS